MRSKPLRKGTRAVEEKLEVADAKTPPRYRASLVHAPFGRDSIFRNFQVLPFAPELASLRLPLSRAVR